MNLFRLLDGTPNHIHTTLFIDMDASRSSRLQLTYGKSKIIFHNYIL